MLQEIYLRIITHNFSEKSAFQIHEDFKKLFQQFKITNVHFTEMIAYPKTNGGEINLILKIEPEVLSPFKNSIAEKWNEDVTDYRWASLFSSEISFIWLQVND